MSTTSENTVYSNDDLGYLNLGPPIDLPPEEGFKEKFFRKTLENPFVPLGLLATVGALTYGVYQLKTGDSRMSQKMMRLRIGAQGFTVFALLGGVYYQGFKDNKAKKEQKQKNL